MLDPKLLPQMRHILRSRLRTLWTWSPAQELRLCNLHHQILRSVLTLAPRRPAGLAHGHQDGSLRCALATLRQPHIARGQDLPQLTSGHMAHFHPLAGYEARGRGRGRRWNDAEEEDVFAAMGV